MFPWNVLTFGLLGLFYEFIVPTSGYAQSPVVVTDQQAQKPATAASSCLELSFSGRVNGGEKYSQELGENLWVRFAPTINNWGWAISVEEAGSTDDYAWPVNPPFHSANSEYLSTGYGETVESKLAHEHRIFFAVNRTAYEQAVKLVNDGATNKDPQAAVRFLAILPTIPTGILYVKPTKFEVGNEGKSVKWMEYSVIVIVPESFRHTPGLNATKRPCPAMHWTP